MTVSEQERGDEPAVMPKGTQARQAQSTDDSEQKAATLTHVVGDQSAVMRFMADPASYGLASGDQSVIQIDTHGAAVFLAGDKAYKIKRAVCFPFMDFSTLARREDACSAEIEINQPNAPEIYLGVVAITRDKTGKLALDGRGEPIEWAVAMNRFDPQMTFDNLARNGMLSDEDLDGAVDAIIAFQKRAAPRCAADWVADLNSYIEQNDQAFHEAYSAFSLHDSSALTQRTQAEWHRMRPLLLARGASNKVRRCHGDLHLRNIVRLESCVRLFDAVEFDARIATGDVLYDLAFLLMDLDEHGRRRQANRVFNRYLAKVNDEDDLEALAALPLFLSVRAALRAKISAMSAQLQHNGERALAEEEAQKFLQYAQDALEPRDVSLTVIGGLSGVGKSAIAQALAPAIGRSPGAVILRSDVVRKNMMRSDWNEPLNEQAYAPHVTRQVYATLEQMACKCLAGGHSVVIDAVCARAEERQAFEALALAVECSFAGVWLEAPLETRIQRIAGRSVDPSDADADVAKSQERYDLIEMDWPRVDAAPALESVLESVRPLASRLN